MAMQRHVENSGEKGELVPDESPLMDALVSYSRFIDELFDQPRNHAMAMEYSVGKIAVRSVGRVLYKLRHSGAEDQPPLSLIARLSEKLVNIVSEIGNHPRRILQRKRSMEPVNRFRELDSSCVRWLIRQPGISIVEKAGIGGKFLLSSVTRVQIPLRTEFLLICLFVVGSWQTITFGSTVRSSGNTRELKKQNALNRFVKNLLGQEIWKGFKHSTRFRNQTTFCCTNRVIMRFGLPIKK